MVNINIIEIELSSLCNAKCSACMRTILDEKGLNYVINEIELLKNQFQNDVNIPGGSKFNPDST